MSVAGNGIGISQGPKPIYTPAYRLMLSRLREARQAAGLTQAKVAVHFARPQSFVSKAESGERRIDPTELQVLDDRRADTTNPSMGCSCPIKILDAALAKAESAIDPGGNARTNPLNRLAPLFGRIAAPPKIVAATYPTRTAAPPRRQGRGFLLR